MFKIIADFQSSALVIAIDFEFHLGWRLAWRPIGNWKVWPSENSFWSNSLYLQKIHLRTDQFWYLPKIMITAGYVNQISIFAHLWTQLSAKVPISLKHVGKFLQMWDKIFLQSHNSSTTIIIILLFFADCIFEVKCLLKRCFVVVYKHVI